MTTTKNVAKVIATEAALALIAQLKAEHGSLMFHQSGGCCDGSTPMCFPEGELIIGDGDVLLGEIGECPFYISASQYEYWKHTQLIIDVASGPGNDFSLESADGVRFLSRSRLLP
ncbi:DUF779 domain-containing protein [Pleurocapsa sp. PCC 7319]|uniref:DUF779 domain-containing protein n=1 Tax=Pleurocapsa sp. PCC 7319 TaxID=118161 RepID=UPI00034DB4FB|nr:DUF779 domain-containing protein [Pleurocapsa sp. PCC 7319]